MNVLGLSCYYHDAAACLVRDGQVVAAAQEERFDRRKSSAEFPRQAINACLQLGNITIDQVDAVAFYEKPMLKLARVIVAHLRSYPRSLATFRRTMPPWLQERMILPLTLHHELGYEGPTYFLKHHLSHCASSFLASPFEEAALLTADGVGEWATTVTGVGRGTDVIIDRELRYPDSLGLVYTAITTFLGFEALAGEGKVMALADLGEPRFVDRFREMVPLHEDGGIRVDPRYFGFHERARMFNPALVEVLGEPREPGDELEDRHRDVAASLQRYLEEVVLRLAHDLHARTGLADLCLAGGVFLNCAANGVLREQGPFDGIFIQPAAGDAGGALGAALYVYHALTGEPRRFQMRHAYLGPDVPAGAAQRVLVNGGRAFQELDDDAIVAAAAERIAAGKILGWCRGPMEFGPRALGHRSILADPRDPEMKDHLNRAVKHREEFRPYGLMVLREEVGRFFHAETDSPYMLLTARVREETRDLIPSGLHVNGTSRLQTVTEEDNGEVYRLVRAFAQRTGVPMVINTSFNDCGEPIVCTPADAYRCFESTRMDSLVVGNILADKEC